MSKLQTSREAKKNFLSCRGGAGVGPLLPAVLNSAQPLSGSKGRCRGKGSTVSALNPIPRQLSLLSMGFVPNTQLFFVFHPRDKDALHSSLHLTQFSVGSPLK